MKRIATISVLLIVCLLSSAKGKKEADKKPTVLHSFEQMNLASETPGSHIGDERFSVLEPVWEYNQLIPSSLLGAKSGAIYPRMKKMADGRYILFCQGGQIASYIYYSISDDLKNWSEGKVLFQPVKTVTSICQDWNRYTTCDAVVLENGDILAVASYRASSSYKYDVGGGLAIRRSTDNGATWSDEQIIYEGTNWEPYLLLLPDGRIQCYFTDCKPSVKDSGSSVITSYDGGLTWVDHMRMSRQYKYDRDGVKIFTDQMPCVRLMADGKTLMGIVEARVEPEGPDSSNSAYMISLIYNDGFDWEPLGDDREGPADRQTNVFKGCAGYVETFPSGETAISCNISGYFSIKLGDAAGRRFNGANWDKGWLRPFDGKGFWGSLERVSSHTLFGAMHSSEGIQAGLFYLNHRIDAPAAKIQLDGNTEDWTSDQALFIGGNTKAQMIVRACHDDQNLYLLAECLDCEGKPVELRVESLGVNFSEEGIIAADKGVKCQLRPGKTSAGKSGYAAEVSMPLSELKSDPGEYLRIYASIQGKLIKDEFTSSRRDNPDTWMRIAIK